MNSVSDATLPPRESSAWKRLPAPPIASASPETNSSTDAERTS
jgi:hypothetical protein